ncbi:hypothetical protein C1645_806438 [Glomus cerebriforme]|uniref:F-box domain-containing protein n=1 Tax=Glomus cerebriforme TaxID=658196 RepID=A0A397SWP8_9GLOM|nr:hypothetical protein C1645_806438 [Glomus cerebriforme]
MLKKNQYLQLLFSNNCLESVIDNLKDNKETLFSCLLVNRLLCKHVIPYLWSSPFDLEINPNKHKLIIRTYISCLREEEKQWLINYQELTTPTIDYPKYLKIFNNNQIQEAVEKFISEEKEEKEEEETEKIGLLYKLITNLLFKNTKGFTDLEITRNYSTITDIKFTNLIQALTKLHTFEFSGVCSQKICQLFKNFAQNINTIQKLSILFQPQNGQEIAFEIILSITELIKSQTEITSLTISQYLDNCNYSEIYSSINFHSNSLKFLRIEGLVQVQQLLNVLKNCNNLETLQLWEIDGIDNDNLFNSNYPGFEIKNIKNLYCDGYYSNHSTLTTIRFFLRICNQNLKMLWLSHVTKEILKDIGDYFPNLNYLSLKIYEEELPYLIKLLPSMILENFTLSIIPNSNNNELLLFNNHNIAINFTTSLIMQLTNSMPITLRYFGIDFIMKKRDFKFFFESLRVPLIQLAILESSIIYDYVLMDILTYAKKYGTLKELIYDQSYDDKNFSEKMLEEARTVIPKIRVLKRGKSSICKNYFDIQYYDESRRN